MVASNKYLFAALLLFSAMQGFSATALAGLYSVDSNHPPTYADYTHAMNEASFAKRFVGDYLGSLVEIMRDTPSRLSGVCLPPHKQLEDLVIADAALLRGRQVNINYFIKHGSSSDRAVEITDSIPMNILFGKGLRVLYSCAP